MSELANSARRFALEKAKEAAGERWSSLDEMIFNTYWDDQKIDEKIPDATKQLEDQVKVAKEGAEKLEKSGSRFSIAPNGDFLFDGERLERGDQRLRGSLGEFAESVEYGDERYFNRIDEGGEAGGVRFELKPEYQSMYSVDMSPVSSEQGGNPIVGLSPEFRERYGLTGGRTQISSLSYGGPGEIIDPSLVEWDEYLGAVTPATNIREPSSSGLGGFLSRYLPYIAAAGMLGAIGMTGGFSGLGIAGAGEAGGVAAGEGLGAAAGEAAALPGASSTGVVGGATTGGTTLGQYGAMTTGLDGLSATSLTAGGGAANIGATTAALTGGGGAGGSILGSAGQWFSSLSPMAQRAIVSGVGQGASALLANRRQEEAQDFARQQQDLAYQRRLEEEERMRREREVRGTPTAMQFTITPRPGIIGSRIGG